MKFLFTGKISQTCTTPSFCAAGVFPQPSRRKRFLWRLHYFLKLEQAWYKPFSTPLFFQYLWRRGGGNICQSASDKLALTPEQGFSPKLISRHWCECSTHRQPWWIYLLIKINWFYLLLLLLLFKESTTSFSLIFCRREFGLGYSEHSPISL